MQINRKDIGYTIYSRFEEALRSWVRENLFKFGNKWNDQVPSGIWEKVTEKTSTLSRKGADDPAEMLEETDMPDLTEIVNYRKGFSKFVTNSTFTRQEFEKHMNNLYKLRCKIAHVKQSFTAIDLDMLVEIAKSFLLLLGPHGKELGETLRCLEKNPTSVIVHIPSDFLLDGGLVTPYLHNLPASDYEPDGGFIGRKEDLNKIFSLVTGDLDRVVTIAGAGGVGKTALAHNFCVSLLHQESIPFDAIVWTSAKEERLTLTGIEPIEPMVRNYEEVVDKILEVYGWDDVIGKPLSEKEESINVILQCGDKGILLVVDNLETIQDERTIQFIKDLPRPNKVLITSRMGLGEVERRYVLKEMSKADSINFIRIVAREKGVDSLARLPDETLHKYAQRMSRYPLAIKWVIGQVALGRDIEKLVEHLTSASGDVARFCFEHIFDTILSDHSRNVLYCLASSDIPLTRGVLTHVSGLEAEKLDKALQDLLLASLVVPENTKNKDDTITTSYFLLPLTLGYLKTKLYSEPTLRRTIQERMEVIKIHAEEANKAGRRYKYALQDLGATTNEEKIAASWALTAYQRNQIDDYIGAVKAMERAVEIAPNFPRIYRNWAFVESAAGYHEKANELMKKATKLDPDDPSLWFVWGNMEKRRNRLDQSFQYFQKALTLAPKDGAIIGALGEVEKRRGNYEKAANYFQNALTVPTDLKGYKHDTVTYTAFADNQCRWSRQLLEENKYDEAKSKALLAHDYSLYAVRLAKDDIRAQDTRAEAEIQLGHIFARAEQLDEAISYFKKAIPRYPKRMKEKKRASSVCYSLCRLLIKTDKKENAKLYYQIGSGALAFKTREDKERYWALQAELFEQKITGKIVAFYPDKGYGFLEIKDIPSKQAFFHISKFIREVPTEKSHELLEKRVRFSLVHAHKGRPEAVNIEVLD